MLLGLIFTLHYFARRYQSDAVEAKIEHGVLLVILPSPTVQNTRIPIKAVK